MGNIPNNRVRVSDDVLLALIEMIGKIILASLARQYDE